MLDTVVGRGAGAELVDGTGAGAELGGASVGDGADPPDPPDGLAELGLALGLEELGALALLGDAAGWPARAVGSTPAAGRRALWRR